MRYRDFAGKKLNESEGESDEGLGVYNPEEDAVQKRELDDTRKPKLTLRMINRLKKIRATKALELAKKDEFLGQMYGNNESDDDI